MKNDMNEFIRNSYNKRRNIVKPDPEPLESEGIPNAGGAHIDSKSEPMWRKMTMSEALRESKRTGGTVVTNSSTGEIDIRDGDII